MKNETECWELFERLTGKHFPKYRAPWLGKLELDGYCEELALAFEYNGGQHYVVNPRWHANGEESLREQQDRDRRKAELCDDNWVTLITIPYWVKDKRAFILEALTDLGYDVVNDIVSEEGYAPDPVEIGDPADAISSEPPILTDGELEKILGDLL